jgi:exonuclease VII small subunit
MDSESIEDFSDLSRHAENNLQATENQIQIDLMKGRVEHLERTREKLTKALETALTKVRNQLMKIIDSKFGLSIDRCRNSK